VGVKKQVVVNFRFGNVYSRNNFPFATVLAWLFLPTNWQKRQL